MKKLIILALLFSCHKEKIRNHESELHGTAAGRATSPCGTPGTKTGNMTTDANIGGYFGVSLKYNGSSVTEFHVGGIYNTGWRGGVMDISINGLTGSITFLGGFPGEREYYSTVYWGYNPQTCMLTYYWD